MPHQPALPLCAETLRAAALSRKALMLCQGWGVGGSLEQLRGISIY